MSSNMKCVQGSPLPLSADGLPCTYVKSWCPILRNRHVRSVFGMVGTAEGLETDRLVGKLDHDPALLVDGLGQRCVYIIAQHGCHYVFHIGERPPTRISRNRMRRGRGYSVPGARVVRRRGVPGYSRRRPYIRRNTHMYCPARRIARLVPQKQFRFGDGRR